MTDLNDIIEAIDNNRMRHSDHALNEADNDQLKLDEIYYATKHGEIIEEYPKDKPFPSFLVLGFTLDNRPVHSVWAYSEQKRWAILVTVYRPKQELWKNNWRTRRKK